MIGSLFQSKSLYILDSFVDMTNVWDDGLVRSVNGSILFSLNPPRTKRPLGRLGKKRIEF